MRDTDPSDVTIHEEAEVGLLVSEGVTEPTGELESAAVKSRAVSGASAMVVRGFAIRAIGLAGNVVLARLLTPADFGIAALGFTILAFASALSEGGIAAGFIRGKVAPTRADLHAAVAVQVYISSAVVAVCAAAAAVIGSRDATIAVVMVVGLPLLAFRTPAYLHFERSLDFGPLIRIEITETLVYFAFAITAVALGAGVWGLAIGQTIRIAVGVAMMIRANPTGFLGPRWSAASVRRMISFGLQFQGIAMAALFVTQGMNVAVASVAGLAGLGVWALVYRLLQIPLLVFSSLRRVSYPAVARLLANEDHDLDEVLLRVAKLAAVMGGLMVVAVLGASDPGVILAFGDRWSEAQTLLPLSVAVVFINGPVSVAAFSYSMASGKLSVGLISTVTQAVAGPLLIVLLYPLLGLPAIAAASCSLAVFEAVMLGSVLWRGLRVNLAPTMVFYGAMVAGAGISGHLVAESMPPTWLAVAAGLIVAEAAFVLVLFVLQPTVLRDATALGRRAVARTA